MNHGDLCLEVV